jgi:serine/threonine protein kinase
LSESGDGDDAGNPLGGLLERARPDAGFASAQALKALQSRLFGAAAQPVTMVGRYIIEGRLGAGGGGTVYRAKDSESGRIVAVKLLVSDGRSGSPRARLLREAQSLAKLSHPNIVEFYEVGVFDPGVLDPSSSGTDNGVFLAMEFVDGWNLAQWAEQDHSWQEIREVFVAAGHGLAYAHERGIAHRDFKPSNVLVGSDGRVRVADFGLARATRELTAPLPGLALRLPDEASLPGVHMALTKPGTVIGTPAYMAPEQHLSSRADVRSDQFSFCLALYEALYRRSPYEGKTPGKLLEAKLRGIIVPPPRDTAIPSQVNRAVVRGLAPDPGGRHESMNALLAALTSDRGAPRPARVALAVGGVVIVIAAATVWGLGRATTPSCGDDLLYSGWDPAREDLLRERVAASNVGYGETTLVRLRERLDRWSSGWSTARGEICGASPPSAAAIACLRASKLAAAGLVDATLAAEPHQLERAVLAGSRLVDAGSCAAVIGERVGDPDLELDRRLWALVGTADLGDPSAATAAATLQSDATDAPAIAAAAAIVRAELRPGEVDDDALRTSFTAARAPEVPGFAARAAAIGLARALADGDTTTAESWLADAVLPRAVAAAARAEIARIGGDASQAHAFCREAREQATADALDLVTMFDVAHACARVATRIARDAEAIAAWEIAAALAERAFGSDHPIAAHTRCELGLAFVAAGRSDPARPHAALGFDVLRRVTAADDPRRLLPLVLLAALEHDLAGDGARRWLSFADAVAGNDPARTRAYAQALLDVADAVRPHEAALAERLAELARVRQQ